MPVSKLSHSLDGIRYAQDHGQLWSLPDLRVDDSALVSKPCKGKVAPRVVGPWPCDWSDLFDSQRTGCWRVKAETLKLCRGNRELKRPAGDKQSEPGPVVPLTMLLFLIIVTYWPPLSLFLPKALGMM